MVCEPPIANDSSCVVADENDSFDIEKSIEFFLADSAKASIQLPRSLSTEQRKYVKKIIENYPSLKCESFGLGEDRQMHVFKRAAKDQKLLNSLNSTSPQNVSVKNTFIDDWINPDGRPADSRTVQSMPHNMFAQRLNAEISARTNDAAEETHRATALSPAPESCKAAESPVEEDQYPIGTEVVIDGLIKAPMFNGASGSVQSWDEETQRYNILLSVATSGGHRWAKVKGENLRLSTPAPPPFASFDQ